MTMLLSLGQHIPYKERARQIRQAACYVVGIMLVTYYAGAWIMSTFGISIPGLRIAGGDRHGAGLQHAVPQGAARGRAEVEQTDAAARRGAAPTSPSCRWPCRARRAHRHDHQRGLVDEFR